MGQWRRWLWVAALALAAAAAAADAEEQSCWNPCVRDDQCVADEVVCPAGLQAHAGASQCSCCPGCVKPLNEKDPCSENTAPCKDGTSCVDNVCTKGVCAATPGHKSWAPRCERDGSFAAVQCKGSAGGGRCFCWAPDGTRLDGQRAWDVGALADDVAANMSCKCSVQAWQRARDGRADEAPRCAADGTYEPLQCWRGVCWCADPLSGAPLGRAVPEPAIDMLSCYDEEEVGASYRRRCDSQLSARMLIERTMSKHGAAAYGLPSVACDLDGSFGPVQVREAGENVVGQQRFCAWKDKEPIKTFLESSTDSTGMNCNCARDTIYLTNQLSCRSNGNYNPYGVEDDTYYCMDNDGYFIEFTDETDKCYSY